MSLWLNQKKKCRGKQRVILSIITIAREILDGILGAKASFPFRNSLFLISLHKFEKASHIKRALVTSKIFYLFLANCHWL